MKTLGLDVSTVSTGWAVLDDTAQPKARPALIEYGTITFSYDDAFRKRLLIFREMVKGVLTKYPDLDYVVVEDTYINKNPKTTKQLNRFAGVAMEAVASYSDKVVLVCLPAVSIRAALYPGKKVDKEYIKDHMISMFELLTPDEQKNVIIMKKYCNDITDAIAAGLSIYYREIEPKWII